MPTLLQSKNGTRTSRRFLVVGLAMLVIFMVWGGVSAQTPPDPPPPRPVPLARDVWLIPGGFLPHRQPDGNSVIFRGPGGLVLLDTGRHAWHREAILEFAKSRHESIVAVINSHWHLDHVSGNPYIRKAYPKVRVYASDAIDGALTGFFRESAAGAREYLKTPGIPPETAEDIRNDLVTMDHGTALRPDTVIKASATLVLAGRRMEIRLSPDGPTAGDVWIFDPDSRIAAVGDLVTLPVPFLDTACVAGWKSALGAIAATPFQTLVPGHGKPMSRNDFEIYRTAFENLVACSDSNRPASECTAGWVNDAAVLLKSNAMDPAQAEAMAAYYVNQVLRPNGGNSKWCAVRPRA